MSRNLGSTSCVHCGHVINLLEAPRPITPGEAGPHFDEYRGMLVATAECPICLAQYLAWIECAHPAQGPVQLPTPWTQVCDLSYLSTFSDEPDESDLPTYDVQHIWLRCGPYTPPGAGRTKRT